LQLLQGEAGYLAELVVGIGDAALQIRGGDQVLVRRVEALTLGNGLIDSHGTSCLTEERESGCNSYTSAQD
jgi:hypothetical protein